MPGHTSGAPAVDSRLQSLDSEKIRVRPHSPRLSAPEYEVAVITAAQAKQRFAPAPFLEAVNGERRDSERGSRERRWGDETP